MEGIVEDKITADQLGDICDRAQALLLDIDKLKNRSNGGNRNLSLAYRAMEEVEWRLVKAVNEPPFTSVGGKKQ